MIKKFNKSQIFIPNKKISDLTKLKALGDDKSNYLKMMISPTDRLEKHFEKRIKCWLPAFSPLPIIFSKAFSPGSLPHNPDS